MNELDSRDFAVSPFPPPKKEETNIHIYIYIYMYVYVYIYIYIWHSESLSSQGSSFPEEFSFPDAGATGTGRAKIATLAASPQKANTRESCTSTIAYIDGYGLCLGFRSLYINHHRAPQDLKAPNPKS